MKQKKKKTGNRILNFKTHFLNYLIRRIYFNDYELLQIV